MRTMNIGKLNTRLKFYKLGDETDQIGQKVHRLTLVRECWGSLYPVRGNEFYEVQKIQSNVTHKCYVRYTDQIDESCSIVYADHTFSIESVIDVDFEHKMLEIYCVEHIGKEGIGWQTIQ